MDLLNRTEVRSVTSLTHPSAQDDVVDTIAAKLQTANAQAEGFGELDLLETCVPFNCFKVTVWIGWVQSRLGSVCAGSAPFGMCYGVARSSSS